MSERIDICLATWNGEKHLPEQLQSIFDQSDQDWRLLVRDDGSTDGTLKLLRDWADKHPDRMTLVDEASLHPGAMGNFDALLRCSEADLVMCCDQDDVWLPDKVARTRAAMKALQDERGEETPLLVHTDLKVVDGGLKPLAESLWDYQNIEPDQDAFRYVLLQNVVTGCTMMINRACLDRALPIPSGAVMHDWWLALVAAAFGAVDHVDSPTMNYRQHGSNTVGAKVYGEDFFRQLALLFVSLPYKLILSLFGAWSPTFVRSDIAINFVQARAFKRSFNAELTAPKQRQLDAFIALESENFIRRRLLVLRYGFWRAGFRRNISWFLKV